MKFTCSFMQAASFTMVFTVDTGKPSPSYVGISLIFISKLMAEHFRDGSPFLQCMFTTSHGAGTTIYHKSCNTIPHHTTWHDMPEL